MNDKATIDYQQNAMMVAGELNFTTVVRLWNDSLPKLAAYPALHFDLAQVSASNSGGVVDEIRKATE
jgi:ABC-type transporter Mla MlaB component